jgi:hypothetical protein
VKRKTGTTQLWWRDETFGGTGFGARGLGIWMQEWPLTEYCDVRIESGGRKLEYIYIYMSVKPCKFGIRYNSDNCFFFARYDLDGRISTISNCSNRAVFIFETRSQ